MGRTVPLADPGRTYGRQPAQRPAERSEPVRESVGLFRVSVEPPPLESEPSRPDPRSAFKPNSRIHSKHKLCRHNCGFSTA